MIYLTLSAGIYRNTDEILWISQPSIWVFFSWRLKQYHRMVMVSFLQDISSLYTYPWWWNS